MKHRFGCDYEQQVRLRAFDQDVVRSHRRDRFTSALLIEDATAPGLSDGEHRDRDELMRVEAADAVADIIKSLDRRLRPTR